MIQYCLKMLFQLYIDDLKIKSSSIIVGTFISSNENFSKLTYGGRDKHFTLLKPSGKPTRMFIINGNFVFVPREISNQIGFLNKIFTHNYADVDYGLRAIKKKF